MPTYEVEIEGTVRWGVATNDTGGSAADASAGPTGYAHLAGATVNAAPITAGITVDLLSNASWPAGCYQITVVATAANGYAAGSEYDVFVQATVDSETPVACVGKVKVVAAGYTLYGAVASLLDRLTSARAAKLDFLTGAVATAAKLLSYFRIALRGDSAIGTDDAAQLTEINADSGAGAGDYANTTDAQEAIRDTAPLGTAMRGTDNAEASGAAAAAVAGLHDFDPANDTVAHVALVDTTTTNTDMRGTNGAYTGTPPSAADIADAIFDEAMSGHTAAGTFGRYMRDIFARMGLGIVTDSGARTIKVYDGLDPATANLLFTLTATVSGNTVTWVRS